MTVSPDEEDFDYDGVAYVASVTGLDWGSHSFYIEVSDGTTATRSLVEMDPMSKTPTGTVRPTSKAVKSTPEAEPGEPLKFRVFYSDEEGHPPAYVRAFLDGEPIELKPEKPVTNYKRWPTSPPSKTLAQGRTGSARFDGVNAVVTQLEQGLLLYGEDAAGTHLRSLSPTGSNPRTDPGHRAHLFRCHEDEANHPHQREASPR